MAEETTNKEDSLNIPFPQYTKNFKKKKKKKKCEVSKYILDTWIQPQRRSNLTEIKASCSQNQ